MNPRAGRRTRSSSTTTGSSSRRCGRIAPTTSQLIHTPGRCCAHDNEEGTNVGSAVAAARPSGTMKAVMQEGSGTADALHLREIDKPALPDDRVLVRVRAASVNALDWHNVHGSRLIGLINTVTRQTMFPIRGVDLAGQVEAVGKDV